MSIIVIAVLVFTPYVSSMCLSLLSKSPETFRAASSQATFSSMLEIAVTKNFAANAFSDPSGLTRNIIPGDPPPT